MKKQEYKIGDKICFTLCHGSKVYNGEVVGYNYDMGFYVITSERGILFEERLCDTYIQFGFILQEKILNIKCWKIEYDYIIGLADNSYNKSCEEERGGLSFL